jgi:hypothetical protein
MQRVRQWATDGEWPGQGGGRAEYGDGRRVARPGRRMRRVCAVTLLSGEQAVMERVFRPKRSMQRVCTVTQIHYEQTISESVARPREEDAAIVYWHTGTM